MSVKGKYATVGLLNLQEIGNIFKAGAIKHLDNTMSMHEIDYLLKSGILTIRESDLSDTDKRNLIWSVENLSEKYGFDAGGFSKTENEDSSSYQEVDPFEIGEIVSKIVGETNQAGNIYDWSAFLLNFWSEYFSEYHTLDGLVSLKQMYGESDFSDYKPIHDSLTIYENGQGYFSDEQNDLIRWFLN